LENDVNKKNNAGQKSIPMDELRTEFEVAQERSMVCDTARAALGLPVKRVITFGTMKLTEALPRYRVLLICIRAALYGFHNPTVKHMVDRNRELDEYAAMERLAKAEGLA
jgi:hypothetical protein